MRIPSHLSWHWATAEAKAEANPLSAFFALGYIKCESPPSFLGTGLLRKRIPSQLSWHWATAEANSLSAFLALGYNRGEYPLSSLGTGSRCEPLLSVSEHKAIAEKNPFSAFLTLGYSRGESPQMSWHCESPLSFPRIGAQQRQIPSQLSWHWNTAQVNTLSAFLNTRPQQRRIPSQLSWHWATAGANPLQLCLLYTSPSPRDRTTSRMPSSA